MADDGAVSGSELKEHPDLRRYVADGAATLSSSLGPHRSMALSATIYNFDIDLADTNRHVYESLALRVARHPSESEEYLMARVLAYLLEFAEGIEFSRGVSDPDEPTIAVRDRTGAIKAWIDVGTPDAARLHKASKAAGRIAVYTHKDPTQFLKQLAGEKLKFKTERPALWQHYGPIPVRFA